MLALFSNKSNNDANITIIERDEITQNNNKVAETLYESFKRVVSCLNTNKNSFAINDEHKNVKDSVEGNVVQYKFHPSVLMIKNKIRSTDTFNFELVSLSDIQNEMKSLNPSKAATHNNIPSKLLRQSVEATTYSLKLLSTNTLSKR